MFNNFFINYFLKIITTKINFLIKQYYLYINILKYIINFMINFMIKHFFLLLIFFQFQFLLFELNDS